MKSNEINRFRPVFYALVFIASFLTARAQAQPVTSIPAQIPTQFPSCSAASKFYSKDSIIITTFGASTVAGVGGFSFQGLLRANIEHCYVGKTVDVSKDAIPGETTTQGLVRFPQAIAGRTGFILILMGANDAVAIVNKKMKIAESERNMRYYIEESIKHNLIPIVGTLQFFDDKNDQVLKNCNLVVKQLNALYIRLAKEYHIYLADINRAMGRDFSLYQDFVHPNAKGYQLISFIWFDTINQAIEEKLLLIGVNQNYPNPVSGTTRIGYSLSQAGKVEIKLFNMSGAQVKMLDSEYQGAGYHEVVANLTDLAAGMYIYVLQVGGQQFSKKLLVVR